MMLQNTCTWEKIEAIGILTLNNPPENLIENPEFANKEIIEKIVSDPYLKGLIIKGAGRHFSAGADMDILKELAKNKTILANKLNAGKEIILIIESLKIPVIASISGVCFGAGLEIALACHVRFCSENALFAFPETNYGIMPGLGGTIMLSKLIGTGKATELILSGEMINSQKAMELRLVDEIKPKKDLLNFTVNYLSKLTDDRNIEVIHSIMQSIHNSQTLTFEDALEEETKLFCELAIKSMK